MSKRGLLIAFEGGDGGGKSTQVRLLGERLNAVVTRQAGGTPLGQRIREMTLDERTAHIAPRAEALLYMADRAEHVEQVIEPALANGQHVVSDRYAYSSFAYQGYGGSLDVEELRTVADWAMRGVWPDVVVLLEVPLEVGEARRSGRSATDHYEEAGRELQEKVSAGYHAMAAADPDRWRIIDGRGSIEEVAARIWEEIEPLLPR